MTLSLTARTLFGVGLAAAFVSTASAEQILIDASLDRGVLHANKKQTAYLRIGLEGFRLDRKKGRAPMNVAIVIDKSSSMSGTKIAQAKAGARAALDQLDGDDIVSVVAYDDTVRILVPATKVRDRRTILRGIDRLGAGGMTALFAGTSKGAAEVRKFLDRDRVNRVVLLSDGQANVGPSSPSQLARLGASLRREGIAVSTIGLGLGYNEDLMVALAKRSGGKHVFVEDARQLAGLFRRGFGSLTSIVAKELTVKITFSEGIRPVRALGIEADIIGQSLTAQLAQLYSGETDELLIEVETANLAAGGRSIAAVEVSYHNLMTRVADTIRTSVVARFSDEAAAVESSTNDKVMILVVEQLANEKNRLAVQLRDQGKVGEARALLRQNADFLDSNARRYQSKHLEQLGRDNNEDYDNLDDANWNRQRKRMKHRSYNLDLKGGDL